MADNECPGIPEECDGALERIFAALEGPLDAERLALIRQDLHNCAACFHAYEFEAELRRVVHQHCREPLPPTLRVRLAQAIVHLEDDRPG